MVWVWQFESSCLTENCKLPILYSALHYATANALVQKLEFIVAKPVYFRNAVKKIRKILGLTFPPKNIGPLHNIFLDTNSKIALIQPLLFFTMIFPNVHY